MSTASAHAKINLALVVGPLRRMTVELAEDEDFLTWVARTWPRPRYEAVLVPELPPWEGAG